MVCCILNYVSSKLINLVLMTDDKYQQKRNAVSEFLWAPLASGLLSKHYSIKVTRNNYGNSQNRCLNSIWTRLVIREGGPRIWHNYWLWIGDTSVSRNKLIIASQYFGYLISTDCHDFSTHMGALFIGWNLSLPRTGSFPPFNCWMMDFNPVVVLLYYCRNGYWWV